MINKKLVSLTNGYDYNGTMCYSKTNNNKGLTAYPWLDASQDVRICLHDCSQTNVNNSIRGGMIKSYTSKSFFNSYCLPKDESSTNVTLKFSEASQEYDRGIGDLDTAKWLILITAFTGIIISYIYLKLVACVGRCLIYLTIIIVFVGGVMVSILLLQHGFQDLKNEETKELGKIEVGLGFVVIIVMIMIFLAICFMRYYLLTSH